MTTLLSTGLTVFGLSLGAHWVEVLRTAPHPTPPSQDDGPVRALATFHPQGQWPVPPCLFRWKKGKNTVTTHLSGDNRVELEDGRSLVLSEQQKIEFLAAEEPQNPQGASEVADRYWKHGHGGLQTSSRVCLGETEKVWVEGCVRAGQLERCAGKDTVLLTPGGASARRSFLLARAHGAIGVVLVAVALWAGVVHVSFRMSRSSLEDLARRRGQLKSIAPSVVAGVAGVGTLFTAATWGGFHGPWSTFGVAVVFVCAMLLASLGRLRVLGAARRFVADTRTSSLHAPDAGVSELAARVANDASPIEGFEQGRRHAFVQFVVRETFMTIKNNKATTDTREVARGMFPPHVPIEDASGRGMLELARCSVDVEGAPPTIPLDWQPPWFAALVGELPRSPGHQRFAVEWVAIDPGDPLLIYGGVERVSPEKVGAPMTAEYRGDPQVPVVRGKDESPAIVHVGDEATLLRGIDRERRARMVSIALIVAGLVGGAAAFVWALRLPE
ncbi:MAG: hypothetical protein HYV09_04355 [Deltaproteobacteria bacterium]|nr:hypothetical protein [Deltaproteobacteria bacterium]